jgi:hypothetical protein
MSVIEWQSNLGYAEDSARSERKPILLDLFNPRSISCQQMDAITYPAEEVVEFVTGHLVPLRIVVDDKSFHEDYHVLWTPTLLILDYNGNEIQRTVGFYEPGEFIAMLLLGMAKVRLSHGECDGAQVSLNRLLEHYPGSDAVPEALYFRGVNLYKMKNNPLELKTAYEKLLADYPDSSWAKRAAPYRLI